MTREELAGRIGKDQDTLDRWESGFWDPTLTELEALATALAVGPADFLPIYRDDTRQAVPALLS